MYDKFAAWTYTGGEPQSQFTRDEMLDDITLYWLTKIATSSAQLYWENNANNFNSVDISIPTAVTVFPPRSTVRHEGRLSVVITSGFIFREFDKGDANNVRATFTRHLHTPYPGTSI